MGMSFAWNRPIAQILGDHAGPNQALFAANEAERLMRPYVPELNRVMIKAKTYVEGGSNGVVHYTAPYSKFQFFGKVMISPLTGSTWSHGEGKVTTDRDLKYSKVGATARWDKTMMDKRGSDLISAIQKYCDSGGVM